MVREWLRTPHVMEWWGEPDEQFGLVSGDLCEPAMDQFIVALNERPLGYIQSYSLTDWNVGFGNHPAQTRGIDQFIGETDMVGRGHGSSLTGQFVDDLIARGIPRVVFLACMALLADARRKTSVAA